MPKDTAPTFQSVILTLQAFWAEQGCVIWQPYYTQVGAGTMNPATFLRVLGPEPWRVAYVEPSIRPDDGRYGENPNRMQQHYQFQVILKPDPGDPQDLYLRSLVALGIDPQRHDIRFVEDNWESPALGAWGLGWEVWLDGQEITQFTYFQQAGGQVLDPVSVELTYGLERILISLQGVESFKDILWMDAITYGDLNLKGEEEHSRYYFEVGDVERLRVMFEEFEAEAKAALDAGLVLPAHDYVLKCSHTFNILDTRGAVGVTERAALFGRMRELARRVAEAYLAQREALGYPFLGGKAITAETGDLPQVDAGRPPEGPAAFLLEIGTEELPVGDLETAVEQLREAVPRMLEENRLAHGAVQVMGTPRRLVVHVEGLVPAQAELVTTLKGPPAERAFDGEGIPTAAAEGFARSKGVEVESLVVRELDGGSYVVAEVRQPGRPADQVMGECLPGLISGLRFEKSMRWNDSGVAFSRPIRWLLALHGEHVVPFEYAGLRAGRSTHSLRFRGPESLAIADVDFYLEALEGQGIVLEVEARRAAIEGQVRGLAAQVGGAVPDNPDLLAEVTNLVEAPTALRGSFPERHLELPREVLTSVMKKHQRCFPVVGDDGGLSPYFIAVRNGGREGLDVVTAGNEHVIRARFADAAYFVAHDMEVPLEAYLPRLATLTFHPALGSMLDKVERVVRLVGLLADSLGLTKEDRATALRAASLCKADLTTRMVVEMTSLQGVMGREYALGSGEPSAVAEAIYEHYLPRFAGDDLPASVPGLVVGLADRLDTLMGLFAAGLQPTGARDPFALRRTAIGLVQMLTGHGVRFNLRKGLEWAWRGLPIEVNAGAAAACLDFIAGRQQGMLLAEGNRHDVVEAVLASQGFDPTSAALATESLGRWVERGDWPETLQAYARCARITRDQPERYAVDPGKFSEDAERELFAALERAQGERQAPGSVDDFLNAFVPMIPAITRFFDEVLVMTEDLAVRRNRLGMLQEVVALAEDVADLSKLEGF